MLFYLDCICCLHEKCDKIKATCFFNKQYNSTVLFLLCKLVNSIAESKSAASFTDPYAIGAWRAQLQLWERRITPAVRIREADKERQWLRGSCTQQVSNYIMSVLNILLQLSSFNLYQQRSCPLCTEWYPKSRFSWSQWPDLHVSLIRVSCQKQDRFCVTDYSRRPSRIQDKTYSCHTKLTLAFNLYLQSQQHIIGNILRWKNMLPKLWIFIYNAPVLFCCSINCVYNEYKVWSQLTA